MCLDLTDQITVRGLHPLIVLNNLNSSSSKVEQLHNIRVNF